ncbi:MAG: VOC family protein [Desulfobacterales bacterium]|nr:VOC family protein [Desulfobacterales bacterium]
MNTIEYWSPMVPEVVVTDFEKSLDFYLNVIGFHLKFQRSDPDFAYLEYNKAQLMIEQLRDDAWLVGEMEKPFGRGVNFQIEVSDVQEVYDRLKKAGISLYKDMDESWYDIGKLFSGQKQFLVQDPDGYLLRFCQELGERSK